MKRLFLACLLVTFFDIQARAQFSTIYFENFENCNPGNVPPAPTINNCGWTWVGTTPGTPWRITGNSCTINGAYSLAVGSDAIDCQYNYTFGGAGQNRRAYKTFPTTGYQLIEVSFTWRSGGEAGIDYGQAVYSTDGVTWSVLPGTYQGSPGIQTTAPITLPSTAWDIPALYLGFEWYNNANAVGVFPGFTIDDISFRGEQRIPDDPPLPVAGSSTCDSSVVTWTGAPPSPSSVIWYWQGTSCGTSTSLGSASTFTAYTSGTYYMRAYNTVSGAWSANCASVNVTVDSPSPTANAGPSGVECDKDYNLNAVPSVGTGSWQQLFGPGLPNFSVPSSPTATVNVTDYGNYIFEWTEQNGSCFASDTIIVTFYEPPDANAGNGGETCGFVFQFGAIPSAGTGTWLQSAGPGTSVFTDPNSPNTDVTVDAYGTYDFTWTESNGGCLSSDVVTVYFYEQPTANAGSGGSECDLDFTFSAVPSLGVGVWTQVFGPGASTFANPTDPVTTVNVTLYGTYLYRWIEINGSCIDYQDITVNFFAPPMADAGLDDITCGLSYDLNGVPTTGTGTWSQAAGPGTSTFLNANNPLTTVTVTATGTYTYEWAVNNNGCTSADTVNITFSDPPLANAGTDANECDLDHMMDAVPSVGTGTWSLSFGPGTANFTNANDPVTTVAVSTYGTYIFSWTEDNGLCDATDDVSVNFFMMPSADAGPDDTACGYQYTLTAFPTIGIGQWTSVSGPGTATISNPNSFFTNVTVSVLGTYLFQWKETNVTCSDSDGVTILFLDLPTPDAGSDANVCGFNANLTGIASIGTGQWTLTFGPVSGVATFGTPTSAVTTVDVNLYGTYVFRWSENNFGCIAYDEVAVNFYEQPVSNAGIGGTPCGPYFTLTATPSVGSGIWSQFSGTGTSNFSGLTAPSTTVTVSTYGTYVFQWMETNGVCSDSDTVAVVFYQQPVADAGVGGKNCDLDFILNANPSVGIGTWTVYPGTGNAIFANPNSDSTLVTVSNTGLYNIQWEEVNGPCSDFDLLYVYFYPVPTASAGNDTSINLGDAIKLNGSGGPFSAFFQWSPDSNLAPANIANPVADPIQTQTYMLIVTSLDGCTDSDEVVVTVLRNYLLRTSEVITPNGDGYNEKFVIDNVEFYSDCKVAIYNRYGNLVYEKSGYANDWDGTYNSNPLPDGAYYYIVSCPGDIDYKGTITIVK